MHRGNPSSLQMQILLIEDNPADVELTRQCFRSSRISNEVHAAMDSETAFAFLHRKREFADAPSPDLILLDLNLPGTDGREILAAIKLDPELRVIPVIVLTTSDSDADVAEAYRLHANSYLRKPVDLDEFFDLADTICGYWSRCVRLPQVGRTAITHR